MAKEIRFTEGLSRVDGAPLEAPYDLTNARLQDASGVEAALAPRTPASDTPSSPSDDLTPVRQGGTWISAKGVAQRGQTTYVTNPPGNPGIEAYPHQSANAKTRIPQITDVDVGLAGDKPVASFLTDANTPRYIYYLLVPINDNGEAGPICFAGAKITLDDEGNGNLPRLDIDGNDFVRWVAVYRTAAIDEGGDEVTPGAQAFYEGERVGAGGGGATQSSTSQWGTDLPSWDATDASSSTYWGKTGIDYIYLNGSQDIDTGQRITADDANVDPVGYRIRFYDLPSHNQNLQDGNSQTYEIYKEEADGSGDRRFHIKEVGKADGSLSFRGKDVLHRSRVDFSDLIEKGAQVDYLPPSGSSDTTIIYSDDKNWHMGVTPDGQSNEDVPAKTPTGQTFERPFNTYAPDSVGASQTGGQPKITQAGFSRPRAADLHYAGGLLYAAALEWPAKLPHPMYIEQDGSKGFDVRLQHEYSLPSGRVFGPPLTLSDVTRLSCGWMGAETALRVYINGGKPEYEIVSTNIARTDTIELHDPPSWFRTELAKGDDIPVRHDGVETAREINTHSVSDLSGDGSSDDVEITIDPTAEVEQFDQVIARDNTHLNKDTDDISADFELEIYDPNGQFADFEHGSAVVNPLDSPNTTTAEYLIVNATHSGSTTTLQVGSKVASHNEGSNVKLTRTTSIDATSASGTTKIVVSDAKNDLGGLTDNTTIDVDGGPNAGSHTLDGAAQANTPNESQTTLPVDSLTEESGEGVVVHGSGPSWLLFRRLTVGPYGMYMRSGSTFAFTSAAVPEGFTEGRVGNLQSFTDRIQERDAIFMSNTDRPLEITFDQFEVPQGEEVRAVFRARLAEEEGIRAYRFYVGTEQAIYVANPVPQDREVSVRPVTTAFGIGINDQGQPARAFVPGGAIIKATNGHLYAVSGRKAERVFPDGLVPWTTVKTLAYDQAEETLLIATDTGVWGYDRGRRAITSQRDITVTQLVWDEGRDLMLGYDSDATKWKVLHWDGWVVKNIDTNNDIVTVYGDRTNDFSSSDLIEVGDLGTFTVSSVSLSSGDTDLSLSGSISSTGATYVRKYETGAVQTQPITPGGQELSLEEMRVDYDVLGYDAGDKSTLATFRQTRRHSDHEISGPVWRNHPLYPGLRGEGLQVEIDGITTLQALRIEGIESAD